MKNKLLLITSLGAALFSLNAESAVFGSYISTDKSNFNRAWEDIHWRHGTSHLHPQIVDYAESSGKWPYFSPSPILGLNLSFGGPGICIDNSSRKVAGKIINGSCYVEHNGKNWKNDSYKYLAYDKSYTWREVHSNYRLQGDEVTAGGWDSGEYVYHCVAEGWHGDRSYRIVGKYIHNQKRCYVGVGEHKNRTDHASLHNRYERVWVLAAPGKTKPDPRPPIDPEPCPIGEFACHSSH
ncbi:DM9 repeat-containing protein [Pseudoalteromonas luteoviolacea]|uniref:Uncharacterized protein n=1 Tax=Pseudoalteromonas luteoviolacea S4054 TaxID=1129367 RepID=A0A0F6AC13_9GAMM|nr:DM9 repeat-containing protein [Pseudoalteromonas luteoviolacea]AOT10602.1 hypothetical protein S4054249_22330 [Pseudoalteromonas luteoviolacea]AOT15330.1 hypothetical protein S40542_21265 [Pseudoalteromonas luteoviolacea]AOT20421.1 hypothetical protein S4054_22245 [Pseudoalteromonas luteoviolacea]KKE83698.1 hypothetical protein N479_12795 [Pseudoalteromonas luteoviolacea S4054]KZN71902.1 hypothetical protein N481_17160 [Pseudoalteromonas luteoviolacea S4047-1]